MEAQLTIDDGAVHVRSVVLAHHPAALASCRTMLSADELARAERFRFEADRSSFVLARGCLRFLLSRFLRQAPGDIVFTYSPAGKPRLLTPARIEFNLSHSGGLALFAFTSQGDIGIDVERLRPIDDALDLARRFFHPDELAELLPLPEAQREWAFYTCWTRKEAVVKATGGGLSAGLDTFRVPVLHPAASVSLPGARTLTVEAIDAGPGYAAAVAYDGDVRVIRICPAVTAASLLTGSSTEAHPPDLRRMTDPAGTSSQK